MATSEKPKPEVVLIKPDKPVSEMTDAERRAYAQRLFDALKESQG